MRYRPDLDGIRAIAVLAVMASHTGVNFCYGGWMGVDVFFVLSGYLITSLLLSEHARSGVVSLRRFYGRRALRLYPALLTMLLALGVTFWIGLGYGAMNDYIRSAVRSGLYLENIAASMSAPGYLPHTWSLAVEEQFYLVWPPILVLLLRKGRDPFRWALLGLVISWAAMTYYSAQGTVGYPNAYYLPWSRFGELLVGGALACVLAGSRTVPAAIRSNMAGYGLAIAGVCLVFVSQYKLRIPNLAWEAPSIALVSGAMIWHLGANETGRLRALFGGAPLRWLGQRSYGMYLIHLPVLYLLQVHLRAHRSELCALMVAATVLLAALSYRFVELPFLRKKARFQGVLDLSSGTLTTMENRASDDVTIADATDGPDSASSARTALFEPQTAT